jgi:hypothetical protein
MSRSSSRESGHASTHPAGPSAVEGRAAVGGSASSRTKMTRSRYRTPLGKGFSISSGSKTLPFVSGPTSKAKIAHPAPSAVPTSMGIAYPRCCSTAK